MAQILGASKFINRQKLKTFLLTTESTFGGYMKYADGHPDILHSFMALAGMSIINEPELKKIIPELCMPCI